MKSSPVLYEWLIHHKYVGKYIENYLLYKAIPIRSKIVSILVLWIFIGISIIMVDPLWLKILLPGIAAGVSLHIALIRTLKKDRTHSDTET